ncbi:MAG TPA: MerR family transcriptional regulator [Verrucomicrobiales bacterium]|nr:MerR family transcriptional regulator [Verrucomicrobiales bacterium]
MKNFKQFITVKAAADYLGVAGNTIRNWGRTGKVQEQRHPVNGYRLYRKKDLDRLLRKLEG